MNSISERWTDCKMKNIIVPIDFSDASLAACKTAAMIAKKTNASIQVLHVAEMPLNWRRQPTDGNLDNPITEPILVEAQQKLNAFVKSALFDGLTVTPHLEGDVVFEQIVQFAKKYKPDLIVMGAYKIDEPNRVAIGSTAQRIMRMAESPVLFVKKDYIPVSLKRILFASSFDEDVEPFINTLKNLSINFEGSIDLAYINTPFDFKVDETIEKRMKKFVHVQKQVEFRLNISNAESKDEGIISLAKKCHADCIALATHWHRTKPTYALGIAETLLLRSNLPVMSYLLKN